MFIPIRKKLGEILREESLITETQLMSALAKQKETNERLGKILVNMGYVKEAAILRILEAKLGIPIVRIARHELDIDIVNLIPEHLAQKYKVIPIEKDGDRIVLAMADPLNVLAIDDVRITTGCDIEPAIASESEIENAINSYYGKDSIEKIVENLPDDMAVELDQSGLKHLREIIEEAPIVRLVNSLITQAVVSRVSDIHVEPREKELKIRCRVDGVLLSPVLRLWLISI
jgi:type IV pilus assembly protein PilB